MIRGPTGRTWLTSVCTAVTGNGGLKIASDALKKRKTKTVTVST